MAYGTCIDHYRYIDVRGWSDNPAEFMIIFYQAVLLRVWFENCVRLIYNFGYMGREEISTEMLYEEV